jgi:crotonobetainyl-CoA:carnitine CoA-transferase CaiB-like acyl-CoA transferase
MGREDLVSDPRTVNTHLRSRNYAFVEQVVANWTGPRTRAQVVEAIGGKVPCGPVNTAADIFADPHVRAREMISEFELPGDNGQASIVANPIKFTATPTNLHRRAPLLDEHGDEIRAEHQPGGKA